MKAHKILFFCLTESLYESPKTIERRPKAVPVLNKFYWNIVKTATMRVLFRRFLEKSYRLIRLKPIDKNSKKGQLV